MLSFEGVQELLFCADWAEETSLLKMASGQGHLEVVKLLVACGANPNDDGADDDDPSPDSTRKAPLHMAAMLKRGDKAGLTRDPPAAAQDLTSGSDPRTEARGNPEQRFPAAAPHSRRWAGRNEHRTAKTCLGGPPASVGCTPCGAGTWSPAAGCRGLTARRAAGRGSRCGA